MYRDQSHPDQSSLVLVAHGSRDPRFAVTARRVTRAVSAALPDVDIELAYLDLNEPSVDDVLARADGPVILVPLLFGDGYHSKTDLPKIVAGAQRRNPSLHITQTPVLGTHSPVPALVDRLAEAAALSSLSSSPRPLSLSPRPLSSSSRSLSSSSRPLSLSKGLGVLLYAVGSSDAGSDASIRTRGNELAEALGVPVETIFATRLGRDGSAVRDAVARLRAAGAEQIAASPLFLSAGLLTERVEACLDAYAPGSLVAGPLGAHPAIVDAVMSLHRTASNTLSPIS